MVALQPGYRRPALFRPRVDRDYWRVRYIRTLREFFHVYLDKRGTLRTDHTVRFLGLTPLRLHYKLERVVPATPTDKSGAAPEQVGSE